MNFVNLPVKKTELDYDKARKWLISKVEGSATSVYEYGDVRVLGISDIDLIVVSDLPIEIPEIPDEYKFAFEGGIPVALMKPSHFRKIRLLGDITVKRIHGEDLPIDLAPDIDIAQVMDWLPERILRLLKILKSDTVDVMEAFGYGRSFLYSVDTARKLLDTGLGRTWGDMFHSLRDNWFENEDVPKLMRLLSEGAGIGVILMRKFADYIKGDMTPWIYGSSSFYINKETGYVFYGHAPEGLWLEVPPVWGTHLLQYALGSGKISSLIKNNLKVNNFLEGGVIKGKLLSPLVNRMMLCNSMAEFTDKLYRWGHLERV